MGFYRAAAVRQPATVERRAHRRTSVDCSATFETVSGARRGRLVDISERGARIEMSGSFPQGISGLLRWLDHEFWCSVVWCENGGCGLNFEAPLPDRVIQSTVTIEDAQGGPVARFGNIPLGRKRSRRAALVSSDE